MNWLWLIRLPGGIKNWIFWGSFKFLLWTRLSGKTHSDFVAFTSPNICRGKKKREKGFNIIYNSFHLKNKRKEKKGGAINWNWNDVTVTDGRGNLCAYVAAWRRCVTWLSRGFPTSFMIWELEVRVSTGPPRLSQRREHISCHGGNYSSCNLDGGADCTSWWGRVPTVDLINSTFTYSPRFSTVKVEYIARTERLSLKSDLIASVVASARNRTRGRAGGAVWDESNNSWYSSPPNDALISKGRRETQEKKKKNHERGPNIDSHSLFLLPPKFDLQRKKAFVLLTVKL